MKNEYSKAADLAETIHHLCEMPGLIITELESFQFSVKRKDIPTDHVRGD